MQRLEAQHNTRQLFTNPDRFLSNPIQWDQLATTVFFKNFVNVESNLLPQDFSFISAMVQQSPEQSMLVDAVHALGSGSLRMYGPSWHQQNIYRANKAYLAAIRKLNKALSEPNSASSDETLVTVLLLAQFEVRNCLAAFDQGT